MTHDQDAAVRDQIEVIARALCEDDGHDPDDNFVSGQADCFTNYGPCWQANERSENILGGRNYVREARKVVTALAVLRQPAPEAVGIGEPRYWIVTAESGNTILYGTKEQALVASAKYGRPADALYTGEQVAKALAQSGHQPAPEAVGIERAAQICDDLAKLRKEMAEQSSKGLGLGAMVHGNASSALEDAAQRIRALAQSDRASAAVPDDWQPIETAPRDGTEILWISANLRSRYVISWPIYEACFDEGWWQPLPPAPNLAADGEQGK